MDNPSQCAGAATEVDVRLGDQSLAVIAVGPGDAPVRKLPLTAAQLGNGDMVEVRLVANRTFVPALEPAAKSNDTRDSVSGVSRVRPAARRLTDRQL